MKKTALFFAVFVAVMIGAFPSVSMECARGAVSLCINTLIPSLLPFLICSNLIISLGGASVAGSFAGKIMMPLFKVGGSGAIPLILGLLSGYPCGAVTLCNLYKSGSVTRNEAHRLLSFVNNSGPLFIISVVGIGVFGQMRAGLIIYAAHILAALTVGILSSFFADGKKEALSTATMQNKSAASAVPDSVISTLNLCGYVIFFAVLLGMLQKLNIIPIIEKLFCLFRAEKDVAHLLSAGVFEISTAITSGCRNLPAISAVISIGGISVLFQTLSLTRKVSLSIKPYIAGKILAGGFSALYAEILLKFFPIEASVFSNSVNERLAVYTPYLLTFSLAVVLFVLFYIRMTPQGGKSVCPVKQSSAHTRS